MELGLGPVDFVLDGDPAPLHQKTAEPSPQFSAHFLRPNGWMHQDATLHGCVRWGPPIDDDSPAVTPPPATCWQYRWDHAKKTTEETGAMTENDESPDDRNRTEQRRRCHASRDGRGQRHTRRR